MQEQQQFVIGTQYVLFHINIFGLRRQEFTETILLRALVLQDYINTHLHSFYLTHMWLVTTNYQVDTMASSHSESNHFRFNCINFVGEQSLKRLKAEVNETAARRKHAMQPHKSDPPIWTQNRVNRSQSFIHCRGLEPVTANSAACSAAVLAANTTYATICVQCKRSRTTSDWILDDMF